MVHLVAGTPSDSCGDGTDEANSAAIRRDLLVEELLEERRRRLQSKNPGGPGGWLRLKQPSPHGSCAVSSRLPAQAVTPPVRPGLSPCAPSEGLAATARASSLERQRGRAGAEEELTPHTKSTWDAVPTCLDSLLGGIRAASTPAEGRHRSCPSGLSAGAAGEAAAAGALGIRDRAFATDIWSLEEDEFGVERREFTFATSEEQRSGSFEVVADDSSSSPGSRQRSAAQRPRQRSESKPQNPRNETSGGSAPSSASASVPGGASVTNKRSGGNRSFSKAATAGAGGASRPVTAGSRFSLGNGSRAVAVTTTQGAAAGRAAGQNRPQSAPRTVSSAGNEASCGGGAGSGSKLVACRRSSTPAEGGGGGGGVGSGRPGIVAKASSRPRSAPPAKVSLPSSSHDFDSKLQEWSIRHRVSTQRQQQMRQAQELHEMTKCTFRPSINNKSEFYARRSRGCLIEPLAERLHHEADKRSTLRQKAKELLEADEMCSYTFKPQINRSRSTEDGKRTPLHLRTEEIRKKRQERASKAQAMQELRSDCSFQPKISGYSARMVQKKRDEMYRCLSRGDASCLKMLGPVEDRLYGQAKSLQRRRAAAAQNDASQLTPSVDDESRRICKSSVYFQGAQQDFITRQQTFELAKRRRNEVRAQHADANCSFRPEISDASRQIVFGNIDYIGETTEERVNRLAVKDVERRDKVRDALQQLHYSDCTFKPNVNPTSQMLASKLIDDAVCSADCGADAAAGKPVHERLYKSGIGSRSRCSEDSFFEEGCTFRPDIEQKARFAHVKGHYGGDGSKLMDNIREELEKKEEHLMELRRALEEDESAECTFAPDVVRPYEEPSQPVVVNGLGRFFELRDMAVQQQRDQQERETKVFHPETRTRCGGVTIPEPFDLSRGPREDSCRKTTKHDVSMADECTFAPQTNESVNKAILQRIMSTPEGEGAKSAKASTGCLDAGAATTNARVPGDGSFRGRGAWDDVWGPGGVGTRAHRYDSEAACANAAWVDGYSAAAVAAAAAGAAAAVVASPESSPWRVRPTGNDHRNRGCGGGGGGDGSAGPTFASGPSSAALSAEVAPAEWWDSCHHGSPVELPNDRVAAPA